VIEAVHVLPQKNWRSLAHERNSYFKCKPHTFHDPWGPEEYNVIFVIKISVQNILFKIYPLTESHFISLINSAVTEKHIFEKMTNFKKTQNTYLGIEKPNNNLLIVLHCLQILLKPKHIIFIINSIIVRHI